jgi:hypothetical protein
MALKPLQFWHNKAEEFNSSAFVLLCKLSKNFTDTVLFNTSNKTVAAYANFEGNLNDEQIKESVKHLNISDNNLEITKITDHHKTVLIPKSLYTKGEEEKIFGFNFSQTEGEIESKEVFNNSHILLYENSYQNINVNGHVLEGILEYLNTNENNTLTLVYISYDYFVILRKTDGKLAYVNAFEYQTSEDFIYYLLFTLEQLEYDNKKETLRYFGEFEPESAIHKLIKQYFANQKILESLPNLYFPKDFPQNSAHRLLPETMYLLCE